MQKFLNLSINVLIAVVMMASCASPSKMHRNFTRQKASLNYQHHRKIPFDSQVCCVNVPKPVISYWQMKGAGSVQQLKGMAVPLLIFNAWKAEYFYLLGKDGVAEDVSSFVQGAVLIESKLNASFKATRELTEDNLILHIEIDSIGAIGTYQSQGLLVYAGLCWITVANETGLPGSAFSRFRYQLKRGDDLLLADVATASQVSEASHKEGGRTREYRSFYNANLVRALSSTIQANIETIVEAVNSYLIEERYRAGSSLRMNEIQTSGN